MGPLALTARYCIEVFCITPHKTVQYGPKYVSINNTTLQTFELSVINGAVQACRHNNNTTLAGLRTVGPAT